MNKPSRIVIHCSDTPTGRDVRAHEIHAWHVGQGWDAIGYHAVVELSGKVEQGRPWYVVGAHARGHNTNSLGICIVGRGEYSSAQVSSLKVKVRMWMREFGIDKDSVVGHYELDSGKSCPMIDMDAFRSEL